ncbi:hypothetical protein F4802DRAFT_100131 [Xylaria palmicola]|nr:hypothetical protein F4802DRAFT_100131 [Xylaria palmicola]
MPQVRFAPDRIPPPIRLGPPAPEYVKTPLPPKHPLPNPDSPASTNNGEEVVRYMGHRPPRAGLLEEVADYLRGAFPDVEFRPTWDFSYLNVTEHWELRPPPPPARRDDEEGPAKTKMIRAHHVHVELPDGSGGPALDELDSVASALRDHVLARYDMADAAAVEFAIVGAGRVISAWYPPRIGKAELMAIFEGSGSRDPD